MKQILLLRYKLKQYRDSLRKLKYRWLGLRIGKGTNIGKISCEWPNKIYIGTDCIIQNNVDFRTSNPFDYENKIVIGDNVFLGRCVEINCQSQITIGNGCWIASNTTIVDIYHETKAGSFINQQPIRANPIIIEEDVWVGSRSIILSGVKIGKGSIIGAGSIVNKSIPAGEIWAGCPVKFIRNRN